MFFSSKQLDDDVIERGARFICENPEIVKHVHKITSYNDEPKLYSYAIIFKDKFESEYSNESGAAGVSFNKKRAFLKALGETVERYSLSGNNNKKFINESYERLTSLHKPAINLKEVTPILDKETQCKKAAKAKIHWIRGKSLMSNKDVLIPAQLIYVPYVYQHSEPALRFPISTGAAAGASLEGALYRGICEVIERDAFMIHYLNKLSSPRVNLSSLKNAIINNVLRLYRRYNLELYIFDITTDLKVPVFAAITIDKTGIGPAVSVGLKAGFDIETDIIGAIEESLMVRSWARDKFIQGGKKHKDKENIISLEDRESFWFPVSVIKYLDFWLKSKSSKKLDLSYKKDLDGNYFKKIIQVLKTENIEAFYTDITDNEIKKYGLLAIKTVIPKLQPLYLDERDSYLKLDRLFSAPVRMGFLSIPNRINQLNKIPHPFL